MKDHKIRFAFAVSHSNILESKHFGDADKYLIYEFINSDFKLILEQINEFKSLDDETNHGSSEKGNSIIRLLKNNGVSVLVSRQFGKNIKMVNQHFVPVVIYSEKLLDVLPVLSKNMKWIADELDHNTNGYKLFTINKGVLKGTIE